MNSRTRRKEKDESQGSTSVGRSSESHRGYTNSGSLDIRVRTRLSLKT